jgi:ABC-type Mn2+/Zn2+ transport system ATPase subunit
MTQAVVRLAEVTAGYEGRPVLRRASFVIRQSEFVGIVGPNGAGKTTLFKVILGLLKPLGGVVEVLGVELTSAARISKMRRRIGYVPQQNQAGKLPITVYDAVLMGRWGASFAGWNRPSQADRAAVEETLTAFGLSAYRHYDCRELSGGLQQRVALARAVIRRPSLVLMDEPTTYLDAKTQAYIYELASEMNRAEGIAFVIISHDRSVLSHYARRLYTINAGSVEEITCLS